MTITKIINKSNNKLLADKVKIAGNFIDRLVGLLNRSDLSMGEGLLIVSCNSIHSFGMRFNFDAAFLDKNNKVVHVIKKMRAWRVSPIIFKAHSVLELPAGALNEAEVKIGDYLEFIQN